MSSETQDLSAVLERVKSLERQNRRMKKQGIAIVIALLILPPLLEWAYPETRSKAARAFYVNDSSGHERAALGLNPDGSPILQLYDKQGKARAILGLTEEGRPSLNFFDDQGRGRLQGSESADGRMKVGIYLDETKSSISMSQEADGTPHFAAVKDDKVIWSAP
jgi:hypothetical protein